MHRVLISPATIHDDMITIQDPKTLHHLVHVLRIAVGDRLECVDGSGQLHTGTVTSRSRLAVAVTVEERRHPTSWPLQITLAQAIIRPERFEWALQKATELGVSRIIPILTQRTNVRFRAEQATRRLERWQRIIQSATEQCGRATIPTIEDVVHFRPLIRQLKGQALLPTLAQHGRTIAECVNSTSKVTGVTVLIGPEGDFTDEEVELALNCGIQPVRLGPFTLRAETAAVVALTLIQHAVGVL